MTKTLVSAILLLLAWPLWAGPQVPRLVSAGASITHIIQALELEANLVGVDSTSLPLLGSRDLPNIGYPRQVSSEGLLSLNPTVVIGTEDMGPPAVLEQLRQAGVEIVILSAEPSMEALFSNIEAIGLQFGRHQEAAKLHDRLQQQLAALPAVQEPRPRALFLLSHTAGSLLVAGRDTAGDSMIHLGGMQNPLESQFSQYRALSAEAFIGLEPLWLITTSQSLEMAGGIDGILALQPALGATPAGQRRQVMGVDGSQMVGGFSPAIADTLLQLRRTIGRVEPPRRALNE